MKAMEENIRSTVRNFVEEELYAREHDPNKNWPISYSHLYSVIHEEVSKADVANKRQSLKEDDLVAEMLPQLVTEEVRLLEQDLKKTSDTQVQLINATIADLRRKIEELTLQNYQFLTDIATIKAHPKIRSKKDKKKEKKQASSLNNSLRSGASSDGQSRDTESLGDDEELAVVDEKRKPAKKGLKLAAFMSRDKDKDKDKDKHKESRKESRKEKVNAYATLRVRAPPAGQYQVSSDVFDDHPVLQQSNSSPNLLTDSNPTTPTANSVPSTPGRTSPPGATGNTSPTSVSGRTTPTAVAGRTTPTSTSTPASPTLTPTSAPMSHSASLGAASGSNMLSSLDPSPSKVAESRAKLVKETFSELYGGNYQTLRDWQIQKLRGLHTAPVSSRPDSSNSGGDSGPRIRQFATIRYHPRRFSEEDCGRIEESLFNSEIVTDLSVKFVTSTIAFLKRSFLMDPSIQNNLFSYSAEESESKILELKTKLEIQPNYEFTTQYDDPKAVASLLILFLKNLPKPLLDKQGQSFLVSAEIENILYRQSVLRSLFYTLPPLHQNMLFTIMQFAHSLVYGVEDAPPSPSSIATPATLPTLNDLNDSTDLVAEDTNNILNTYMGTLTRSNASKIPPPPLPPIAEDPEKNNSVGKGSRKNKGSALNAESSKKKRKNTLGATEHPMAIPLTVFIPTSSTPTAHPLSNPLPSPLISPPSTPPLTSTPTKTTPPKMQSSKSSPGTQRPAPPSPHLTTSISYNSSSPERPTSKRHTKSLSSGTLETAEAPPSPIVRAATTPSLPSPPTIPTPPAITAPVATSPPAKRPNGSLSKSLPPPSTSGNAPSPTASRTTPRSTTPPPANPSPTNSRNPTSPPADLTTNPPTNSTAHPLAKSASNPPATNPPANPPANTPVNPPVNPPAHPPANPSSATARAVSPPPPISLDAHAKTEKVEGGDSAVTKDGDGEFSADRLAMFCEAFAPILSPTKTADPDSVHLFNILVHDYNPVFLHDVREIEYIVRNGLTIVKAASLDRLVEKLMDPYYKDPEFSDIMFLCYNYFMQAAKLLEILIEYYNTTVSPVVKPWQTQLAVRVLVIIKMWIMRNTDSLQENQPFMEKLHTFIESVPNRPQEAAFFKFFKTFHQQASPLPVVLKRGLSFAPHILGDARAAPSLGFFSLPTWKTIGEVLLHSDSQVDVPTSPYGLQRKDGNIAPMVDLGAVECSTMAIQLTLVDHELLRAIKPSEFLHKNFTRLASSPNFNCMVNKFNEWGMWVCSVVLAHEKLNDRVSIIAYFIELAKCCVEINNFNAGCALIGGLNHSSISRLKTSWEKVPSKSIQDYERLLTLFDMSLNYKNYREALKMCKPPAIPYLGLFPKDLTAVEEGNENHTLDGLINFEKFRLLSKQVKKIEAFQHPLFSAKIIPKINAYLKNLKLFSEKELYEKSLLYEPRK
eukprot:Phypoly_transcript_00461.p1 GENE.Phypoly_transcript_00461~~Phypoly_transcript_00461.p1  ORF type:complete len:1571 (+),score=342.16 Phypoly_transcript_00461:421-4713(+)